MPNFSLRAPLLLRSAAGCCVCSSWCVSSVLFVMCISVLCCVVSCRVVLCVCVCVCVCGFAECVYTSECWRVCMCACECLRVRVSIAGLPGHNLADSLTASLLYQVICWILQPLVRPASASFVYAPKVWASILPSSSHLLPCCTPLRPCRPALVPCRKTVAASVLTSASCLRPCFGPRRPGPCTVTRLTGRDKAVRESQRARSCWVRRRRRDCGGAGDLRAAGQLCPGGAGGEAESGREGREGAPGRPAAAAAGGGPGQPGERGPSQGAVVAAGPGLGEPVGPPHRLPRQVPRLGSSESPRSWALPQKREALSVSGLA